MDYRNKFKKSKFIFICITAILAISLGWTIGVMLFKNKNSEKLVFVKKIQFTDTINNLNEDVLLKFINLLDIQYPEIVLNQAKLETGNFTSQRFKKYNALFGFQKSDSEIIKYKSWKESVIDYKCWQMKRLKNNENYYDFLVRIKYASDSNYINKLKQF